MQLTVASYAAPGGDTTDEHNVVFNTVAEESFPPNVPVFKVLFEGKLGVDRPGRVEYERQAGERGIIVWRKRRAPTDADMVREAGLFVVNEETVDCDSVASWNVPVMSVGAAMHESLQAHVESEFTWHCNALPPRYLRVLARGTVGSVGTAVLLQLATSVKRYSFDTTTRLVECEQGDPPDSPDLAAILGLSGRVTDCARAGAVTLLNAGMQLYDATVPVTPANNLSVFPLSHKSFSSLDDLLKRATSSARTKSCFIAVRPAGTSCNFSVCNYAFT